MSIKDVYGNGENEMCINCFRGSFLFFRWAEKKEEEKRQNKKVNNLKDKNVHKLVLLYFLKPVLFGNEGKNIINMQWVGLIDGSKVFNNYP